MENFYSYNDEHIECNGLSNNLINYKRKIRIFKLNET